MTDDEILAIGFDHWLCDKGGAVHDQAIHGPENIIAFARVIIAATVERTISEGFVGWNYADKYRNEILLRTTESE